MLNALDQYKVVPGCHNTTAISFEVENNDKIPENESYIQEINFDI